MTKNSLTLRFIPERGVVVGLDEPWDTEDVEKWVYIRTELPVAAFRGRDVCVAAWLQDGQDFTRSVMPRAEIREIKVGRWPNQARLRIACLESAGDEMLREAALYDQFHRGDLVLFARSDIAADELAQILQSKYPQDDWGMPITNAEIISVTNDDDHVSWLNPRLERDGIRDIVQRLAAPLRVREVRD